jgi:hypothetical protein
MRLSSLMDEYEAMFVFLGQMNSSVKARFKAERHALSNATKRELQAGITKLTAELKRLRRETGASQPLGAYAPFLRAQVSEVPERGFVLSLPIYMGLFLFGKYPSLADRFENHEIPAHAFIELDYTGSYESLGSLQFQIPEAMLFEDMCSFWNEACRVRVNERRPHYQKLQRKRLQALLRGAVSSAFYMVEAFCNGLAFETYLRRWESLTENDRQRIQEWDATRNRPKYLTIRDKILHYPRLVIGAPSPLIQENNSTELAFFLTSAKELRDAIVHANPAPDYRSLTPDTLIPQKWQALLHLNQQKCAEVVDSSIAVIDQIAVAIDRQRTIFWLQRRRPDGLFDESVFN